MPSLSADDPRAVAVVAAIQNGSIETLQQLLRDDPELATSRIVDVRGVGRTLLHIAADWPGHFPNGAKAVGALVSAGADVNARVQHTVGSGSPETALHWAASSDDVAVLTALLDAGANIEADGAVHTGGTAMSDAVVFAQWKAARELLERGARTTIWQSAALGLLERVQSSCANDPKPTPHDITNAFWHACRGGQLSTATFLSDIGADTNWVGHDGMTPLDAAQESSNEALLRWLASTGARRGHGARR
jgi:uncharacterized protein